VLVLVRAREGTVAIRGFVLFVANSSYKYFNQVINTNLALCVFWVLAMVSLALVFVVLPVRRQNLLDKFALGLREDLAHLS
jgi:hypothetical protein